MLCFRIARPVALAIDFSGGHMIYWADSKLNSIEARRTVPKVFLLTSTRKIVTQVVADWGCVGFLAPNDPVFQDRFQAAYAVEVLKLKVIFYMF